MQTVWVGTIRSARESFEGEVRSLDLTNSKKACLLSSGSEHRGSEMNDYFEDRLRLLDESRLAELAVISTLDVEDILGARVPLPDKSSGETERTGSQSIDEELGERVSG